MDKNIPQNIPIKAPETRVDLHWENIKESNKADMPNSESGSLVNLHSHNKNMIMRKQLRLTSSRIPHASFPILALNLVLSSREFGSTCCLHVISQWLWMKALRKWVYQSYNRICGGLIGPCHVFFQPWLSGRDLSLWGYSDTLESYWESHFISLICSLVPEKCTSMGCLLLCWNISITMASWLVVTQWS